MAGIAVTVAFTGCLDGSSGGGGGGSIAGAWTLSLGTCRQQVAFQQDGTFDFGVSLALPGGTWREGITGTYSLSGAARSSRAVQIEQAAPPKAGDIPYCAQWARRSDFAFPLDALSGALGESVGGYSFRPEFSTGLGTVSIGTSPSRRDRVALFQEGDVLRAARLDGTAHYVDGLFASLPDDPIRAPVLPTSVEILNVPEAMYRKTFDVFSVAILEQRVLNVTSASDVTFTVESPGGGAPRCQFVAFADLDFSTPLDPSPLPGSAAEQTLRLNPAEAGAPLVNYSTGGMTGYLFPMAIVGVTIGTCTVTIRAVSTAAAVLEGIRRDEGFQPLFALPISAVGEYAIGFPYGHREVPRRLRWWMGLAGGGLNGLPERIGSVPELSAAETGQAPAFDVLGLLDDTPPVLDVSVAGKRSRRHLSVHGAHGGMGLGPFVPAAAGDSGTSVDFPGSFTASFAAPGTRRTYRFTLDEAARVALWSDGGADTHATLSGPLGKSVGSDDDGSADGAGFRIVRTLEAGDYRLSVTSRGAGTATIHLEAAGGPPVPDEELEACLIANGLESVNPAEWERLSCAGQKIMSLQGIADVADFRVLELAGNRIADAAPLAALSELRVLSLADNLLTSADALAGLPRLHTLVLAYNPLTAATLGALAPLADTLRLLDLTGVDAATGQTLVALRSQLPMTAILDRDGNVVP